VNKNSTNSSVKESLRIDKAEIIRKFKCIKNLELIATNLEKIKGQGCFKRYTPISRPGSIMNDRSRQPVIKCFKKTFSLTNSVNVNITDYIDRLNEINICCIEALGKLKAYFGKKIIVNSDSSYLKVHNSINSFELLKKKHVSSNFDDMFLFDILNYYRNIKSKLRNCRIYKQRSSGKITFVGSKSYSVLLNEWQRLFVELNPKINYSIKSTSKFKKNEFGSNSDLYQSERYSHDLSSFKTSDTPVINSTNDQESNTSTKNMTRAEIITLMNALTKITADTNSYKFKRMVEIITSSGKISYDSCGQMEVDFSDLDKPSLSKLKELSREFISK